MQRKLRSLGRALATATIAILAVGSVAGAPWISREYRSFTALKPNPNASVRFLDATGFRYDLWRVALREFRGHPLGGVGAGNYDVDYYRLRHNPEYVVQPHSLELQMAAELGVGGLVALLVLCGSIFWAGFAPGGTLASEDRMIRLSALGMFTAWFIHTSVDWLYDIPGLTGMAIVAGALLVLPSRDRRADWRRHAPRRGLVLAGLLAIAVLAASVGRQYVAERYAIAGAALVGRSPRAAIDRLREAARLDPFSLGVVYSLASAYAHLDDYADARAALALAALREPHNYVPATLLGDLAMRRGYYGVAVAQYEHALALNPRDPAVQSALRSARSDLRSGPGR